MIVALHAELVFRANSADEFARHAGPWLTEAWPELFPELAGGLAGEPALSGPDEDDPDAPWGPPGAVYGEFLLRRKPFPAHGRHARYTTQSWRKVVAGLGSAYPLEVDLLLTPLDENGQPYRPEGYAGVNAGAVVVSVLRRPECPEWVQCSITAPSLYLPWSGSEVEQQRWVDLLGSWAVRLDACYGHLTDDADSLYGTALERASVAQLEETIPRCRTALRGYSWVTVCAAELAGRLGGVAALTASGAFHRVTELPGGQVLLRTTPLLEQYEGAAVTRVFEVLAPVLVTGRTRPEATYPGMRLVIGVDAADYR